MQLISRVLNANLQKRLFIVVVFLSVFVAWQCIEMPRSPVFPTWNTQLSIPLVDTSYYLKSAFAGDSAIKTVNGAYQFAPPLYSFNPVFIGDTNYLQLNPPTTDTSIGQTLGPLVLGQSRTAYIAYLASQLLPATNPPIDNVDTTTIPANSANGSALAPKDTQFTYKIPPDSTFVYADLISGGIQLAETNSLPFADSTSVIQIISDLGDTLATFNVPGVPANGGSYVTPVSNLAGKRFTSGLKAIITHTTSTVPLPVTLDPGAGVTYQFNIIGPLQASDVEANLPPQVIVDTVTSQQVLDDSTYLNSVVFKRGAIRLTLTNSVDAAVSFFFKFQELVRNSDGSQFIDSTTISPNSTSVLTISLDETPNGYSFQSPTTKSTLDFSLHIATLQLSQPSIIYDTSGLSMRVQFLNTPFLIHSISGRLAPTYFPVGQGSKLTIPQLGGSFTADSINADSAKLRVQLLTAAGHTTDFNMVLTGFRNGVQVGAPVVLPGNGLSPAGSNIWRFVPGSGNNVIEIQSSQFKAFLRQFPNNEPDSLYLGGYFIIDPTDVYASGQVANINDTMNVYANAQIVFPLSVGIYNGLFKDTLDIGNSSNGGSVIDQGLLTSLIQGKFGLQVNNTVPAHLLLQVSFIDSITADSAIVVLPAQSIGKFEVFPDSTTNSTLVLTQATASKFGLANKMIVTLALDTQNQVGVLTPAQYVKVRMWASIVFNVNPDVLKNK